MFFSTTLAAEEAYQLVSWWKPFLLLLPFIPWAIIVSKVLDKHAARFILPRQTWGTVHVVCGAVALIAALSLPMKEEFTFWIGWALMMIVLAADIVAFAMITNKDERVPEQFRLTMDMSKWTKARDEKKKAALQGQVELNIKGPDKSLVQAPQSGTPEFDIRVASENVFTRATGARATQIDFNPGGKDGAYAVTFMIDGVRTAAVLTEPVQTKDGPPPPPPGILSGAEALKLMDFWRGAAKLDLTDRRKRQSADITIERGTLRTKVRVSSIGSQAGMRVTILLDPEGQVRRKTEALGLLEPQMEAMKTLIEDSKGVVLVTAPPDGGRTTAFYTVLKMHDAYTRNVQTLELEMQDTLEGIRQNKFDPQSEGSDFGTTVRSILRRDPDVVGVAEMPDANTAKEVAKVDAERCRVYLSFQAASALGALQTYLKAVGDPDTASKTLHGVVCSRVLRRLCTNCRQAYQPSADMLKKLGLPADKIKQLFKKGGQVLVKNKPETCPACGGVGYVGLEGVFEVFPLGVAERAAVKAQDWNALKMEFRKKNLPMIQQAALRKALDGITSVEEVLRATADEAPKPAAAATPKPAPAVVAAPQKS
ncbi:Type II secretion system protein E [Phycisphaerales bacterium]|nr:Type II secretion system protein E [Phycisphaerales bacterium]